MIRIPLRFWGLSQPLAILGLGLGLGVGPAVAEEGQPPAVQLDQLLKLPRNMDFAVERRGGATRTEWRTRFEESRLALQLAREDLARSQQALEQAMAGSPQWSLAPPGMPAGATDSGGSYRLKQDVRRSREELERTTRRLQDLIVEANLAGVPEEWRH